MSKKKKKNQASSKSASSPKQTSKGSQETKNRSANTDPRNSNGGPPNSGSQTGTTTSMVSRYVSFGLLLAIILIFVILFYEVMAKFLIPLFLAALLVVIFRPLHAWVLRKSGGRQKISAMATTAAVMLMVLVPISALLVMAAAEGREAFRQFNTAQIYDGIKKIRTNLNLDLPMPVRVIDSELAAVQQDIGLTPLQEDEHRRMLYDIHNSAKQIASERGLPWPEPVADDSDVPSQSKTNQSNWELFASDIQAARQMHQSMKWSPGNSEAETIERNEALIDYQMLLNKTGKHFSDFRPTLLGGKTKAALVELVNPSEDDTTQYIDNGIGFLQDNLVVLGKTGASFLGNMILGTAIMVIGLYFFLLDGPRMIESFKGLSPIDDEHEEELVSEFGRVSRAVVIATLLSALVQGLLAGIGFYFAGLESIFLLTVLSAVLAMVPFVGAAAVWIPCSLYLYFIDNNMTAAIALAIYGAAVISMADNVIKPFVLHGQSNLHPLLALLSVLGGVATLGPIGILIGPMVVAFLQTLLKILQREMQDFDNMSTPAPS